jgi:hypothetical protein
LITQWLTANWYQKSNLAFQAFDLAAKPVRCVLATSPDRKKKDPQNYDEEYLHNGNWAELYRVCSRSSVDYCDRRESLEQGLRASLDVHIALTGLEMCAGTYYQDWASLYPRLLSASPSRRKRCGRSVQ